MSSIDSVEGSPLNGGSAPTPSSAVDSSEFQTQMNRPGANETGASAPATGLTPPGMSSVANEVSETAASGHSVNDTSSPSGGEPSGTFLNGEKPNIAIVDSGWGDAKGHANLVKDVIESQLGQDGEKVDISEFSSFGIDSDDSIFSSALKKSNDTGKPFDYLNLSGTDLGGPAPPGWPGVQAMYNNLKGLSGSPDALNLERAEDLSPEQRKDMLETFLRSPPSEPPSGMGGDSVLTGDGEEGQPRGEVNYIQEISKLLKDGRSLMEQGTNIYKSAGNQTDIPGNEWGPGGLLKALNDELPGSYNTVGAINHGISDPNSPYSTTNLVNEEGVKEKLLSDNLIEGGMQLDDVSLFANGILSGHPGRGSPPPPASTSEASPEAVVNDILSKGTIDQIPESMAQFGSDPDDATLDPPEPEFTRDQLLAALPKEGKLTPDDIFSSLQSIFAAG